MKPKAKAGKKDELVDAELEDVEDVEAAEVDAEDVGAEAAEEPAVDGKKGWFKKKPKAKAGQKDELVDAELEDAEDVEAAEVDAFQSIL